MEYPKFAPVLKNFIVFEGLDGCGTTTQTNLLYEKFKEKKLPAEKTCEPTSAPTGRFIREILSNKIETEPFSLALLFSADRNEHIYGKKGIKERAENGETVICDRYLFSSLAYQSMFVDFERVLELNRFYPLPEYLFFIDLPSEKCQKRMASRKSTELFEKPDLQEKTAENYRKTLDFFKDSPIKTTILDGTKTIEEIHEKIWNILNISRYL